MGLTGKKPDLTQKETIKPDQSVAVLTADLLGQDWERGQRRVTQVSARGLDQGRSRRGGKSG